MTDVGDQHPMNTDQSVPGDIEQGGSPPCWAHLFEEDDEAAPEVQTIDLSALAAEAGTRGPVWTMRSEDLDLNLISFQAGEGINEHLNPERDVLLVGIVGEGLVTIDNVPRPLRPGQAILVPKGARRSTWATTGHFAYLTCHRTRPGLQPSTTHNSRQ